MRVNRIQNNNYNSQPSFGTLNITKQGAKALRKAFSPEQLEQIKVWSKELESTKHFDLEVKASYTDNLIYIFRHKTNSHLDSEAPLHAISVKDRELQACGVDLLDCGDWFYYHNLKFPTKQEAANAYTKLTAHENVCRPYRPNNFDDFKWVVDSVKILDKTSEYTESNKIRRIAETILNKQSADKVQPKTVVTEKPALRERIANAWQALKGN